MFTRVQQEMGFTSHPGILTLPWEEVFPPEQRPSFLVLDDLMRETVGSDQVIDLLSISISSQLWSHKTCMPEASTALE